MVIRVKELTVDELKIIIRETMEEKFQELVLDPDEGLEIRDEVVERLKANRANKKPRIPMAAVMKKYGSKEK